MEYTREYLTQIASIMWQQIIGGVGANVAMSWGISKRVACVRRRYVDGYDYAMPCLLLQVQGLVHTGFVLIGLNESTDTYEVKYAFTNLTEHRKAIGTLTYIVRNLAQRLMRLLKSLRQ